jgi:uncharacterized protein YuzE
MKLNYYPETNSLYIELTSSPGMETHDIITGVNVDLDEAGDVVGFYIDHASKKLDLTMLETIFLPLFAAKVA